MQKTVMVAVCVTAVTDIPQSALLQDLEQGEQIFRHETSLEKCWAWAYDGLVYV